VVEGRCIDEELLVVLHRLEHTEAVVDDLDQVVLENMRLKDKCILSVLFTLLFGSFARVHSLND
jgi:hypothetical protein